MTERGRADLSRSERRLAIGPSAITWDGDALVIDVEERATPVPLRAVGRIRVVPEARNAEPFALDPAGRHVWHPLAPAARVDVMMKAPAVRWSGHGYVDMNFGAEPLEAGFRRWNWSRALLPRGSAVFYEGDLSDGEPFALALRFDASGRPEPVEAPPLLALPRTVWGIARATRADGPGAARVVRTLEDTPFYSRSVLASRLFGADAPSVHESVDLTRFASRWVQTLLPYRMPRKPGRE